MDLHYRTCQAVGREPWARLVSIHGFGEHGGMLNYRWLAEALTRQGIEVWQPDLRGNGRSPGPRGFIADWSVFREDVRRFIGLVPRDKPLILCGLSMGGLVVLDYGMKYAASIDGVVSVVPPLGQVGLAPWLQSLSRVLSKVWPGIALDSGLKPANLSRDQVAVAEYLKDELFSLRGTARLLTELQRTSADVRNNAGRWSLPLLLLQGSADPVCPIDETFPRAVPGRLLTRKVYAGARHNLYLETNRDEVFADIAGWIRSLFGVQLSR